jgi:integral membrane protein (TIGR01906 family)
MRPLLGPASIVVAAATAIVLTAAVLAPFLSPAWVSFEQGRADAAAWTGYSPAELRTATDAILGDLVLGPPTFDVEVGGMPVLTAPERSHMRDVRGVFTEFYLLAALGLVILGAGWAAAARSRAWTRDRFWGAVRSGAIALAVLISLAGIIALVAFDAAFAVFHSLFFPAGTYDFDPRFYRLTQLFPDAFWSETSVVVGAAILLAALVTAFVAVRRIRFVVEQAAIEPRTAAG